ncbi:MAG: hypothetical protein NTW86_03025 [Candidatus Sumerlaeota bacterium]|nr:hypothetical protein [Candidatus Sumerlaeota bacterium]
MRTRTGYSFPGVSTPIAAYDWMGGRLLAKTMENGTILDLRGESGATVYDGAGRPTTWYWNNVDYYSDSAIGWDYAYDRVGNKLAQYSYQDDHDSQCYAYDSANRLTAWVRGVIPDGANEDPRYDPTPSGGQPSEAMTQAQRFDLDGVGNWSLTRTKVDDVTENDARPDTTFNEYTTVGSPAQTQSYDDNGNLTGDGSQTYKWDAFNRLREVWTAGGSPTKIVTYTYDAANRRVRKDLVNNTYTPDLDYYYDNWRIVQEHENGAANPARQFVYGAYIDEPLVLDVNTDGDTSCVDAGGSDRLFYHQNTIYSVYALTDADAALVDVLEYDPYGRHWLLEPGEDGEYFTSDDGDPFPLALPAYASPFLFTGREFDGETGLHCYRERFYGSQRGSFLSRDPLRYKDGPCLYSYVGAGPLIRVDPMGRDLQFVQTCDKCGPEIGHQIWYLLDTVTRDYNSWPEETKRDKCFSLFGNLVGAVHAWDIPELHPTGPIDDCVPPGCATGGCQDTVRVQGGCHLRYGVNYVLLGHITRLCGNDVIQARNYIWWYTHLFTGDARPKLDWFYGGYFGNWPPPAPTAYASCRSCPKGSMKDAFSYHWGS